MTETTGIIPGLNDRPDHFAAIADIANQLKNVREINRNPYHPLGKSKNQRIGKTYDLTDLGYPDEQTIKEWENTLQHKTKTPIKKS